MMMMAIIINDGQTQKTKTKQDFNIRKKTIVFFEIYFILFLFGTNSPIKQQQQQHRQQITLSYLFFRKKMIRKIARNAQVSIKSLSYTSHWLITFDKDNFVFLQRIFFLPFSLFGLEFPLFLNFHFWRFSPYIISMATDFFYFH